MSFFKGLKKLGRKIVDVSGIPPRFEKIVFEKYKDWTIDTIYVCRTPLTTILQGLVKIAPGVKLGSQTLYHVDQVFKITDGKKCTYLSISKDETVYVTQTDERPKKIADTVNCRVLSIASQKITVSKFFSNLIVMADKNAWSLWLYNPKVANCQYFVWWGLEANGLGSKDLQTFVLQDTSGVGKHATKVMSAITTGANAVSRLLKRASGNIIETDDDEDESETDSSVLDFSSDEEGETISCCRPIKHRFIYRNTSKSFQKKKREARKDSSTSPKLRFKRHEWQQRR